MVTTHETPDNPHPYHPFNIAIQKGWLERTIPSHPTPYFSPVTHWRQLLETAHPLPCHEIYDIVASSVTYWFYTLFFVLPCLLFCRLCIFWGGSLTLASDKVPSILLCTLGWVCSVFVIDLWFVLMLLLWVKGG